MKPQQVIEQVTDMAIWENAVWVNAVEKVFFLSSFPSLICVKECKSAINKKESFSSAFERAMAGKTAPSKLPK